MSLLIASSLLSGQISDGLIGEWIKNGAKPTDTVKALIEKAQ